MNNNFFYSCKLYTLLLIDIASIMYLVLIFSEFFNINFYLNERILYMI